MKFMKKKAGFTLVELIVVIAVLAILAGIAVPTYSNYIAKAESAADLQVLAAVNTACQSLAAGEGTTVEGITVDGSANTGWTVNVSVDGGEDGVEITSEAVETLTDSLRFSEGFAGATWSAGEWSLD